MNATKSNAACKYFGFKFELMAKRPNCGYNGALRALHTELRQMRQTEDWFQKNYQKSAAITLIVVAADF
ncbi:MAG: hypothetical protein RR998_00530 [Oscillospiraceae bacterium]